MQTADATAVSPGRMKRRSASIVRQHMHGDNTGMADSCRKLETMLRFIGRDAAAEDAAAYADHLEEGKNANVEG